MAGYLWREEELELLGSLVNSCPGKQLCRLYKIQAGKKGLRKRTDRAIRYKAKEIAGTIRPLYDNHSIESLARILKVARSTLGHWVRLGLLNSTKGGKHHCITNKDVVEFLEKYPQRASICDLDGLIFFIDRSQALQIKSFPPLKKKPQKVVHVPSGKVYHSIKEASRQTHWDDSVIRDRLKKGIEWAKVS